MGIGGRGDELYSICFNDIAAVVSNSPIIRYKVSRENTLAHEKAIEEVMKEYTVLPVRFATITEDEEKVKKAKSIIINTIIATIILLASHAFLKDLITLSI